VATNLAIDDSLLTEAQEISGLRTKKAVVTQALVEYIQKRQQSQLLGLFGSIQYEADYDYKAQRKAKHASAR
jgi:Arc/MetJ family transcription regulator